MLPAKISVFDLNFSYCQKCLRVHQHILDESLLEFKNGLLCVKPDSLPEPKVAMMFDKAVMMMNFLMDD